MALLLKSNAHRPGNGPISWSYFQNSISKIQNLAITATMLTVAFEQSSHRGPYTLLIDAEAAGWVHYSVLYSFIRRILLGLVKLT